MSVARVSNIALATVVLVVLVGLLAACGSSESLSIAEEPIPTTSLASVSENSPTTPTTMLPATSERNEDDASQRVADRSQAVTTTTVPVPPALVAREDALYLSRFGVGSQRFGDDMSDVISSLINVFGLPQTDVMRRFRETEEGAFIDRNGDYEFVDVFGRETCFSVGLCIEGAGETDERVVFTGWTQRESSGMLVTESGLGVGSRWSSFATDIDVEPLGCGMYSTGSYRNMRLEVRSLGEPFNDADEISTSAGDIVVISVSAGDVRSSLHPAC
ncbi:MAG: hypothetical protein EBY57_04055 [Actinobacteria bacterium]|nr:hypothetical protein [Actinomycetota bacterium]